jgi:excisionase family DNA binding protein
MARPESAALPRLLTVNQVADILGCSPWTLYAWRGRGEGPPSLKVGSRVRYRPEEVDRWIESQEESTGASRVAPEGRWPR